MSQKKYLRIKWTSLLIRYGILYVAFVGGMFFAGRPLLSFSVGYWIIFGLLMLIEGLGSYTLIKETEIVKSAWFFKWSVPFENLISFTRGKFYGIGNPDAIIFSYKMKSGKESKDYILFDQYSRSDIKDFVVALKQRLPGLSVESSVEKYLT